MRKTTLLLALGQLVAAAPAFAQWTADGSADPAADAMAAAADAAVDDASEAAMAAVDEGDYYPRDPSPSYESSESWIQPVDYPPQAWVEGQEAYVGYTLAIDASGAVTGCEVTGPSEFPLLNDATCPSLLKRAKFDPALDDSGKAIAGTYTDSAYWAIRKQQMAGTSLAVTYLLDAAGEVHDCTVLRREGTVPEGFEENPCPGATGDRNPFRDENGNPVARQVTIDLKVDVDTPGTN